MNISFENQVALVTGAASGIGLATAKGFARAGASVALADVNGDGARAAADELVAAGYKAIGIRCNVADLGEVEAMVKANRLQVRPPGCGLQQRRHSERARRDCRRHGPEDFDRVNSVNLRGVWALYEVRVAAHAAAG
jgi:NAD(P)-dependent dehydrogenase (short-subunit alcohol dehydrogenase family)